MFKYILFLVLNFTLVLTSCNKKESDFDNKTVNFEEKFGVTESILNKKILSFLHDKKLNLTNPILILACKLPNLSGNELSFLSYYELSNNKKIELGIRSVNPVRYLLYTDGSYGNNMLTLMTTLEPEDGTDIVNDITYKLPNKLKYGITPIRYFEITCKSTVNTNYKYFLIIYNNKNISN